MAVVLGLAMPHTAADEPVRGDVRRFGAIGDGIADDTAAIQKAVNTVEQGTVYLPPGVYRITAPITLRPGLSLVGEPDRVEVGGSTLLAGRDMEAMIRTPDFGHMLRIESLTLDGGADEGRAIGAALDLQGFCAGRVGNVRVRNLRGHGLVIGTRKATIPSWIIVLDRLDVEVQGEHRPLHMAGTDAFLTNSRFAGGIGALHDGGGNVCSHLVFEHSLGSGLTQRNGGISLVDSIFRNNARSGLAISGPAVSTYGGNRFEHNGDCDVLLEQTGHVTFADNAFLTASPRSGRNIEFHGTSHVALVGNRFAVASQPLPDDHAACADNVFGVVDTGTALASPRPPRPEQSLAIYMVQSRSPGLVLTDVKRVGAVGDGIADDAPAIQRAIDAAGAGGVVFFPVGTYLVKSPLVLRSGVRLLGEGNRDDTSLILVAEGLPAAVQTPQPVSDVLITRLAFGEAGVLDLARLTDGLVDLVVCGEIRLGPATNGTVVNACQVGTGVRLMGGRGNALNAVYTREVTVEDGTAHVIRGCNIDLSRATAAVRFTAPAGAGTGMTVRNCYFQLHDRHVLAFDYDSPHRADARIDGCLFRSNGTFRTSRARVEDFDTNPEAVRAGLSLEISEAIPEIRVRNARDILLTNNIFDYYEHLDPVGIRTDFLETAGDVDGLVVVGNKLRVDRGGLPGGRSRLEHNVAGQVMPQPAAVPPPVTPPAAFSFAPNQFAGCPWYRPGDPDRPINGHLDESFGRRDRWPVLVGHLKTMHGSFGMHAAEIGHLADADGLLALLRAEKIPVSIELPAWTQPLDGIALANAEIHGGAVDGANIFARVFRIEAPQNRPDPFATGWFVTRNGTPFVPDEIVFDERVPNLLPEFDAAVLARTAGTWEERKQAARRLSPFTQARQPFDRLLTSLLQDYVRYIEVARAHWGPRMPAVSLHWNVNPAWEWRDERGLDAIQAVNPAWCVTPADFFGVVFTAPQYNSVRYLEQLIDTLRAAGIQPRTVYMDVDWNYSLPYATEVLRRHKQSLAARGVQMGINVVEAALGAQEELLHDGQTLVRRVDPDTPSNLLYERTLVAIVNYLRASGVYGPDVQLRVGSWSRRPAEMGAAIDETIPGSLAHTANRIVESLRH